jgi:hypothetical protein
MVGNPTGNLIGTHRRPSGQGTAAGVQLPLGFPLGLKIWIGFSLNTVLIELWLRTRGRTAFL